MMKNQFLNITKNVLYFVIIYAYIIATSYYEIPYYMAFILLVLIAILVAIIEKKSPVDITKLDNFKVKIWLIFVMVTSVLSALVLTLIPTAFGAQPRLTFSVFAGIILGTRLYVAFGIKKE